MIRRITEDDRLYIYSIIKKVFNVDYKKDNIYTNWYIYELDNKIVGFINYDIIYDKVEIEYIYVDSIYRNRHIGTHLFLKMLEDIKDSVDSITLEVRSSNIPAIKFYQKLGFKEVSIRENYYGSEDAIVMLKSW